MAMYYQTNSEIQTDGLHSHTLHLMNPNYTLYSDAQPSTLFFNNPTTTTSSSAASVILHAPPPLSQQQDFPAINRLPYNTWGLNDHHQSQQTPRGPSLSLSAHRKSSVSGEHDFPMERNSVGGVIVGSKYLKAARELLEEVVNVGNEGRKDRGKTVKDMATADDETTIKSELTAAQKQEIQMKKSKLNTMLEKVEQRCRQYHQQMQIVMATFEEAAGSGSARAYTQLALKTILKQFRCLKRTISAQIKGLNKSLGEEKEESLDNKLDCSRLKFVDSQVRFGMMQNNNVWRPQRGLPERAVSVLRAWLFEHFLHPYPKDLDKQMLAKQTGLTRSQVSNWFINARVRLWKPMVEEMYREETKNQDASVKITAAAAAAPPLPELSASTFATASLPIRTNFAQLISSLNTDDNLHPDKNPKKPRNASNLSTDNQMAEMMMSGGGDRRLEAAAGFQGNSFSLSLALQPTQSSQFLSHSHRNFDFGRRIESEVGGGRIIIFQNRKPFPAQLLPDFVA